MSDPVQRMDLADWYLLGHDFKRGEVELVVRPKLTWDEASGIVLGRGPRPAQFTLLKRKGNRWTDDLFLDGLRAHVVSERVVHLLQESCFSGWKAIDAGIEAGDSNRTDYKVLLITGRCGPLLDDQNPMVDRQPITSKGREERRVKIGYLVDPASWDGSDIVSPEGTALPFVHERVKRTLESEGVTGFTFVKITESERLGGV